MRPFQRIFQGFLLVLIDFYIGPVEVFPDFIGYILIAGALTRLPLEWREVRSARVLALLLAVVSIPAMFLGQPSPATNRLVMDLDLLTFYHHALGVLKLFLVYFLFEMLIHWASDREEKALIKRAKKLFSVYFYIHFAYYALLPFFFNTPDTYALPAMIVAVGAVFVVEISFILLLRAYDKEHQKWNGIQKDDPL
ncbi:hypothetical protein SAMN04487936_106231 [Halobacillus dabanensis]|uniref:Uncharacterized protein n=1 Tax=Halobacillus dabanensis TaxID=240302 RepID=A0A1I3WAA9_HALDA|nr:hypothetical protein [Halobacillus dabanensis]SFK03391.1 hypothetical protein SAMN04487936_106231 [Halobacillus dabanensis]